jgi:hypothetical protein
MHINIMLISWSKFSLGAFRQLWYIVGKDFNYLCSAFASRPVNKS